MTGTLPALLDPEPAPVASGCITGQPCTLGCGLFCALEPVDAAPAHGPRMGGPCRACGTSAWACFSSGPCCGECDH